MQRVLFILHAKPAAEICSGLCMNGSASGAIGSRVRRGPRYRTARLPPNRYERAAPGDIVHLDIKRLVRIQRPSHRVTGNRRDGVKGIGAEFLHVAIDDSGLDEALCLAMVRGV